MRTALLLRRLQICVLVQFLFLSISAQYGIDTLGIRSYGNTIENRFHSAEKIHQDSLNRLIFYFGDIPYQYDGHSFKELEKDSFLTWASYDSIHNITWYLEDLFTLYGKQGDKVISPIQTKTYFDRNITRVLPFEKFLFILTNNGLIQYEWQKDTIDFFHAYPIEDTETYDMQIINDSIFINGLRGNYYLSDFLSKSPITRYNEIKNKTHIVLPDGRFAVSSHLTTGYKETPKQKILSEGSPLYDLLRNPEYKIDDLLIDAKGGTWLNCRYKDEIKGIFYLEPEGSIIKLPLGIDKNLLVWDFYEDHEKNIWIGTVGSGLIYVYDQAIQTLDKRIGLPSENIMAIQQSTTGLHFMTNCNGIAFVGHNNELSVFRESECQATALIDKNDTLWVSAYPLKQYKDQKLIKAYTKADGFYSRSLTSLLQTSDGQLWGGTRKAIHKYIDGKWKPFIIDTLSDFNLLFNIVEITTDSLLLAFTDGEVYTFSAGIFELVQTNGDKIKHLFKDLEGRIWIVGTKHQLYRYNDGRLSKIELPETLPKEINFLQDDSQGYLWGLCANNEIFYVQKNQLWSDLYSELKYLGPENGLPLINSNTHHQPSSTMLNDGRIVFPNIHGAIMINPQKVKRASGEIKNYLYTQDSIFFNNNHISLPRGQSSLNISFVPVAFNPNHKVELRYRLNEGTWIDSRFSRELTLNKLPYGQNTLEINYRYASDDWAKSVYTIFAFKPLIYQWWFILLLLLTLMFLAYLYSSWRNKVIAQRNKLLKERVVEQTNIINEEKEHLAKVLEKQQSLTKELKIVNESKNKLYAQISHEFKSPLQSIKSYILSGRNKHIIENQDLITKNIDQLLSISTEIMDLSKAESGQLKAKKDYFNICELIQQEVELKTPLAGEKNIKLHIQEESLEIYLHYDIQLMQKVISNLLTNAIKFSPNNSSVIIELKRLSNKVEVSFIDQGIGIAEDEIELLTKAYFQASNNHVGGTGIGLSLVDQILSLHNSQLQISSELNNGSHFSFCLDLPKLSLDKLKETIRQENSIDKQLQNVFNKHKPTILIVDDSKDVLYFLRQLLSGSFNVVDTNNPISALDKLSRINPQLIISDQNMPLLNGISFLKKVRINPSFESVPFILLTGSESEETELLAIKSGANFFLKKPIDEELLFSLIEQTIDRQEVLIKQTKSDIIHSLLPKNISDEDRLLMNKIDGFLLSNIENNKLRSVDISNALSMGEKTLRNKVKEITGFTLRAYLKQYRITKAKELIASGYGTKGEVARAVGFSSLSYFTKAMKADKNLTDNS